MTTELEQKTRKPNAMKTYFNKFISETSTTIPDVRRFGHERPIRFTFSSQVGFHVEFPGSRNVAINQAKFGLQFLARIVFNKSDTCHKATIQN